jgi:geranylgeranyl pyrophosphate synthase
MEAGAIPGIAIPLLRDGCKNTEVDLDWVREAVRLLREGETCRPDLDTLRAEVDGWFTERSLAEILGRPSSQTERIAIEWLAKSGKRWRPFLVTCVSQALQNNPEPPLPDDLRKLALAIECFHKASLVHDDIEDHDESRYGAKTLHEQHGIPIALNVGDLLLGEGYRMIGEIQLPADRKAELLQAAAAGHRSLCIGQGEELCWMRRPGPLSVAEVLDIFRQKTAPAFEVALRFGAVYSGTDPSLNAVLHDYAEALGIAYQIRDDLNDFWDEVDNHQEEIMSPSLLLAIAYQQAIGEAKGLLEAIWRRPDTTRAMSQKVKDIFAGLRVEATAQQMLEAYRQQAIRALRPLDNADLKALLRRVIGKIFDKIGADS